MSEPPRCAQRQIPSTTAAAVIGLDVGGAHLKLAALDATGQPLALRQIACPLWQGLDRLYTALDAALLGLPQARLVVATMTGELVDRFSDRCAGVRAIVGALRAQFAPTPIYLFAGRAGLLDAEAVSGRERAVASANWLATGRLVAELVEEALVVDCGSTTTDIVPLACRQLLARGFDDRARLAWGELVYQGVVRTPLCSLAQRAPFRGLWHGVMNEWFATTADVYRLLGRLDETMDLHPAADGGPKTVEASARRLARMIGCDFEDGSVDDWRRLAAFFAARQLEHLEEAVWLVLSRGELTETAPLVAVGSGAFVIEELAKRLARPLLGFADLLGLDGETGRAASVVAPAYAVARLGLAAGR